MYSNEQNYRIVGWVQDWFPDDPSLLLTKIWTDTILLKVNPLMQDDLHSLRGTADTESGLLLPPQRLLPRAEGAVLLICNDHSFSTVISSKLYRIGMKDGLLSADLSLLFSTQGVSFHQGPLF